jgi:hypothetical protein
VCENSPRRSLSLFPGNDARKTAAAFDGGQLMGEIILLRSPATVPENRLILLVDVGDQRSLCVVNDQLVGNPKRKV